MSTLKTFNLQHPSSAVINASLESNGAVTAANIFNGNSGITIAANGNVSLSSAGSTRITLDTIGRIQVPGQPAFSVSYSGAGYAASEGDNTTWDAVIWNTTTGNGRHNTGNHYNSATGMFTAPLTGRYLFLIQVHHASGGGNPSAGYVYADIAFGTTTNQSTVAAAPSYHRSIMYFGLDTWYELPPLVTILQLSANDSIFVRITGTQNTTWLGSSRPDHNRFSGYYLG